MWKHDYRELIRALYERLNRLLEESMSRQQGFLNAITDSVTETWEPAVDIYEQPDAYLIEVEIAGADRERLNVHLEGNRLIIHGYRGQTLDPTQTEFHRVEIPSGEFSRVLPLPEDAHAEGIEGEYQNGILRIVVPKRPHKSRVIPISSDKEDTE